MADRWPKWERFERLTGALLQAQDRGARVVWDDSINGWQVDVSVLTDRDGRRHLEIIECKDHARRVTQEQIAAFVTKVQETGADSGSFVSAVGFQKGARRLARKRGVSTFRLEEVPAAWPSDRQIVDFPYLRWSEPALFLDGSWRLLSSTELAEASFTTPSAITVDFEKILERPALNEWEKLKTDSVLRVALSPGWMLRLPGVDRVLVPQGIAVRAIRAFRKIQVNCRFPEEVRPTDYTVTDELNSTADSGQVGDLPFGFDAVLREGAFYRDAAGREYICERLSETDVRFVLLANRQFRREVFAAIVADIKEVSNKYMEITDAATKARLAIAYETWKAAVADGKTIPGSMLPADLKRGAVMTPRGEFPQRWW